MKHTLLTASLLFSAFFAWAQQPIPGTTYSLPRTALRFSVLLEKTEYQPGEFAAYAGRYMKELQTRLQPETTWRLVRVNMTPVGIPDTAKQYTLQLDKKLSITEVDRSADGLLLAINTKGYQVKEPDKFIPSVQKPLPNPKDFMSQDILSAGSTAKMAQLTAQDIYDIRDSRAQLTRGQADFMPKDGAQLRIMMANLNQQEQALMQTFEGTTRRDTTEVVLTFIPTRETDDEVLFRLSARLGLTDKDDLAGEPYVLSIKRLGEVKPQAVVAEEKKTKDDFGLNVNLPDRISITLSHEGQALQTWQTLAGQFGQTETLSADLFGKKQTCRIVLNPIAGSIEKIESVELK